MISRNLSWNKRRENFKRRIAIIGISVLAMLFIMPVRVAMVMSKVMEWNPNIIETQKDAFVYLGFDAASFVICIFCAVMTALDGFVYLYDRRKTDMYISQPVSAKERFYKIYTNGVLIFLVPYVIMKLLSMVVVMLIGGMSGIAFNYMLYSMLLALIVFLAIYNLTLIAVMLTGQLIVAGLAILTLLAYEVCMHQLVATYFSTYYVTYSARDFESSFFGKHYFVSPLYEGIQLIAATNKIWQARTLSMNTVMDDIVRPQLGSVFTLILQVIVFGAIAYWCYMKRPTEAGGRAIAFDKIKCALKVLIMIPCGMAGGAAFYMLSDASDTFFLIGLASGMILCQIFIEIIFEFDVKAALNNKRAFVVGVILTSVIYLIFKIDLFGYDRFVPDKDDVQYAAVDLDFNNIWALERVNEDYANESGYMYDWEIIENMQIHNVDNVLNIAKVAMSREYQKDVDNALSCTVKYKLDNGRERYRHFVVNVEDVMPEIDGIFEERSYKESVYQILQRDFEDFYKTAEYSYSTNADTYSLSETESAAITEAYQKDLYEMSFTDVKDLIPCGCYNISKYYKNNSFTSMALPVFDTFYNTKMILDRKDIPMKEQMYADEIVSLEVEGWRTMDDQNNGDNVVMEKPSPDEEYYDDEEEYFSVLYTEPDQIEEIVPYLYRNNFSDWAFMSTSIEPNVYVYVNKGNDIDHPFFDCSAVFRKDMIPDIVRANY